MKSVYAVLLIALIVLMPLLSADLGIKSPQLPKLVPKGAAQVEAAAAGGGGNVSIAGSPGQVAVFSNATFLTGYSQLLWNTTYNILNVLGIVNATNFIGEGNRITNITFNYNHTQAANTSIFNTYDARWSLTFNQTYHNFAYNQTNATLIALNRSQCPAGNYTYGIQINGTLICRSDLTGAASSGNISGGGVLNQIAVFNSATTIKGYNSFIFDQANGKFGVGRNPEALADFYQADVENNAVLISQGAQGGQAVTYYLAMDIVDNSTHKNVFWQDSSVTLAVPSDDENLSKVGIGVARETVSNDTKLQVKGFGYGSSSYTLKLTNIFDQVTHSVTDDGRVAIGAIGAPQHWLDIQAGDEAVASINIHETGDFSAFADGGEINYDSADRLRLYNGTAWTTIANLNDISSAVSFANVSFTNRSENWRSFNITANKVIISNNTPGIPSLTMQVTEHSSVLNSKFSITDSRGDEMIGATAWNGGGGLGGYGNILVSSNCNTAGTCYLGGVIGKNQNNSLRIVQMLFETNGAADTGLFQLAILKNSAAFSVDVITARGSDGKVGIGTRVLGSNLTISGNFSASAEGKIGTFANIGTNLSVGQTINSTYANFSQWETAKNTTTTDWLAVKSIRVQNATNSGTDRCTLVSGACTIANNRVTNNTNIFCFDQSSGGTIGSLSVQGRNAGVNYSIGSANVLDTSVIGCLLIEGVQVL